MATRMRWLGHSCLLFESGGQHVLIDPFLNGNPLAAAKADEVPANFILVSHGHGADTGLFGDMKLIGEEGIDLALLPIGDNFTMGPFDALRALALLTPGRVVPIHYNTFDVIKQDPHAWAEDARRSRRAEPVVLHPG